jgi:hypothetical protein
MAIDVTSLTTPVLSDTGRHLCIVPCKMEAVATRLYEQCSKCQGLYRAGLTVQERSQSGRVDRMLQFSTLETTFQKHVKIRKDGITAGYHNRSRPLFPQSLQDMTEQNRKELSLSYKKNSMV